MLYEQCYETVHPGEAMLAPNCETGLHPPLLTTPTYPKLSDPYSSPQVQKSVESLIEPPQPCLEGGLLNLTDDLLGNILSRLPHKSIESAACTCQRLSGIVRDDERTWLPACKLRWSDKTDVRKWAGGRVAYRPLYHVLRQCEKLVRN